MKELRLRIHYSESRSLKFLFVGCSMSQQHTSVSQEKICSAKFICCHTNIEVADQTFYLTQSQYTDSGPTSPSADPTMSGVWQGSHWSTKFKPLVRLDPEKPPQRMRESNSRSTTSYSRPSSTAYCHKWVRYFADRLRSFTTFMCMKEQERQKQKINKYNE